MECSEYHAVIKYESVIHEFDPYFNYRVTQFLSKEGFYNFWNWFDDRTWYPLGRVIGGTVYPGLTLTAGTMWWLANALNFPFSVETVCVFTAPVFSAHAAWATFLLAKEVRGTGAGLTAAALIAMVPSYISRSVAGSYDNEGVAIFALVFTFYLYIKTLNTGSLFYATANAAAYFYMVMSWGGYTFIINLIPIHVLLCIVTGRFSSRLYIAFAPLIILGTLLAALVPVVGFNAVMTSEHFGGFLVFVVLHIAALSYYIKALLPAKAFRIALTLIVSVGTVAAVALLSALVAMVLASPTLGWTGRSLSLLDPTYASKYIPIIASVSEHQPPMWTSYFMDLQLLAFLAPAGLIACFLPLTDASSFVALYLVVSVYFSGVMVRLMLVLAPAACITAGIAVSALFDVLTRSVKASIAELIDLAYAAAKQDKSEKDETTAAAAEAASNTAEASQAKERKGGAGKKKKGKEGEGEGGGGKGKWGKEGGKEKEKAKGKFPLVVPGDAAAVGIILMLVGLAFYTMHCVWAAADAYSAPSIVLSSPTQDGGQYIFDDFREAYGWLRHNTDVNDKVASWWDYGYQTTAMANRTVIVDNNTWNNTHIATVGMAMSSREKDAWAIYRSIDVKYVFVVFGGMVGYPSDDINKFLWMVRIGGGVFPRIREPDYLNNGNYRVDGEATSTMLNCLMYKLSYYRFAEVDGRGFDRVRRTEIGKKNIKLTHFEEVFTSQHWMVRIYRLKEPRNRPRGTGKRLTRVSELHAKLQEVVPQQQERIRQIKSHYGNLSMGKVTVNMAIGGMRGVKGLVWETSQLDPEQGIKFRGYSIPECQHLLPKAVIDGEPMPEGLLWLLLTGEVPTREQAATVTHELHERAKMPEYVHTVLNALPRDMHPMTQLSIGVMALQKGSRFARAYHEGMPKSKYWHLAYEDALDLIATLPQVAAHIYRHTFKDGKIIPPNEKLDYAANFAHMLGFNDPQFHDLMRLYLTIHADHEGGNVSAHATHLVGSALSDPYLSFAAGLNGLAGPLHGLANQEVLRWLEEVKADVGEEAGKDELRDFVWRTLQSGKVVPGYGHAVLRVTDPRYSCQRQFALKHLPHDPTFKLVSNLYEVVPHILLETGKVKNPWPNVDAHSGVLLQHYGLTEASYYTVLFGVSRAMGVLSQLVWDRALGFPIERPKSITLDWIEEFASDKAHKEEQHAHEHKH
ncbi:unnamed protein product [Closterium sp. NIES-65]|nr:unnamed protein product [Closterium sp. NIES-65]